MNFNQPHPFLQGGACAREMANPHGGGAMNLSLMAEVFALLLVLVFLAPLTRASVLCDDGGSCSVECHPGQMASAL